MSRPAAAIVTVGTELVRGLAVDTNTSEIARALDAAGIDVAEAVSVADDEEVLAAHLKRCTALYDLVVVTGGLGPTHDDITRTAASEALGLELVRHEDLVAGLRASAKRHVDPRGSEQVFRQADVLAGARVLPAVLGTAPGQIVATGRGHLVLLPGPPREMRSTLPDVIALCGSPSAAPRVLRCTGLPESDVQLAAQDVLSGFADVELTVLAKPGEVRVVLFDRGAGDAGLDRAAGAVAGALGDACFSTDGTSLPEVVIDRARAAGYSIASAESCTGGLIGAALTSIPGASDVYPGGIVAYSNDVKTALLGVDPALIDALGAVSDAVAMAMAAGIRDATGADLAVAVTGIAGPGGGTDAKPVGTVWFGLCDATSCRAEMRRFPGDRDAIRERSVMTALDLLRRTLPGPEPGD